MTTSTFDMFKIGIGPSSSHTMGPMVAAGRFLDELRAIPNCRPRRLNCTLRGSLAFTGKGHATDRAVILGLAGCTPATADPDKCDEIEQQIRQVAEITPAALPPCKFAPDADIEFNYGPPLPQHPNGIIFRAFDDNDELIIESTYFSTGGGFVVRDGETATNDSEQPETLPYPFHSAEQMLAMGRDSGFRVVEMIRANELARYDAIELDRKLDEVWTTMTNCIDRGLRAHGQLPGKLRVRRRAAGLLEELQKDIGRNDIPPHQVTDWLAVYAMAVNEENAAGGRVVTAPTNGAAGVIPAVTRYYLDHCPGATPESSRDMLLVAAGIGSIIKRNASISGAEVGCQGEVGSASAMAAAALCSMFGGTNEQVENAAEIALEHHLGMTCDPVAGLVQIPCIERNGFGAVKAVAAASLAMRGDGQHHVSLDQCVETMRQTGMDMLDKYKETSQGGLAVNVVAC